MRVVARFPLLLVLVLTSQSSGADLELNELKYAPAVRELREYDTALRALKKKQGQFLKLAEIKHERELAELREQTSEALKKIQDEATKDGRLDDALAIREAIKRLSGSEPEKLDETPMQLILDKIDGTVWVTDAGQRITFQGNRVFGTNKKGEKSGKKLVVQYGDSDLISVTENKEWVNLWHFTDAGAVIRGYMLKEQHIGRKE